MKNNNWNFNNSYTKLPKLFYSNQKPIPVTNPKLVIFNDELAVSLGVPFELDVLAGNSIPKGSKPISQAYTGHQFGYFTMLGDGRAVLLGEQITPNGERLDIQLKGSGRTPYSRNGDGRAALGPMLREYIISEAMHHLGIATTRSLAVVETGEIVEREKPLTGAILTRVAASHIRVGTFEYASRFGTTDDVRALADYTIERHFPFIVSENTDGQNKYLLLLREVVNRQVALIATWQLVGFIHGVMNTDNMAISGETIDYGPCAFMDAYNPDTVFSSIDTHGRYAYKNQPNIAIWNLGRFAESLLPLLHNDINEAIRLAEKDVIKFHDLYKDCWFSGMRAKLGLFTKNTDDKILIDELLNLMQKFDADYTNTFRYLTLNQNGNNPLFFSLEFQNWHHKWQARLDKQGYSSEQVLALMKANNPFVIPRNQEVEKTLNAAEYGDLAPLNKLLSVLKKPYDYNAIENDYLMPPTHANCNYRTFCGT